LAGFTELPEARTEDDGGLDAFVPDVFNRGRYQTSPYGNNGDVCHLGQLACRRIAGQPCNFLIVRINGVDAASITFFQQVFQRPAIYFLQIRRGADNGNGLRPYHGMNGLCSISHGYLQPSICQRKALRPVCDRPSTRPWMSYVPSSVLTVSMFMTWRIT